jgi:hypothetical protein
MDLKMAHTVNHFSRQSNTQRAAILRLLIDAHGAWVPLPEIMACAAQYNARIFELRKIGFTVENKNEVVDGVRHSWFRLIASLTPSAPTPKPKPTSEWNDRPRTTGLPLFDLAVQK